MTPLLGHVDASRQLTITVPPSIPLGPVKVFVVPLTEEDETGAAWATGVAQEWADDLGDPRQDIYTLEDGEPV